MAGVETPLENWFPNQRMTPREEPKEAQVDSSTTAAQNNSKEAGGTPGAAETRVETAKERYVNLRAAIAQYLRKEFFNAYNVLKNEDEKLAEKFKSHILRHTNATFKKVLTSASLQYPGRLGLIQGSQGGTLPLPALLGGWAQLRTYRATYIRQELKPNDVQENDALMDEHRKQDITYLLAAAKSAFDQNAEKTQATITSEPEIAAPETETGTAEVADGKEKTPFNMMAVAYTHYVQTIIIAFYEAINDLKQSKFQKSVSGEIHRLIRNAKKGKYSIMNLPLRLKGKKQETLNANRENFERAFLVFVESQVQRDENGKWHGKTSRDVENLYASLIADSQQRIQTAFSGMESSEGAVGKAATESARIARDAVQRGAHWVTEFAEKHSPKWVKSLISSIGIQRTVAILGATGVAALMGGVFAIPLAILTSYIATSKWFLGIRSMATYAIRSAFEWAERKDLEGVDKKMGIGEVKDISKRIKKRRRIKRTMMYGGALANIEAMMALGIGTRAAVVDLTDPNSWLNSAGKNAMNVIDNPADAFFGVQPAALAVGAVQDAGTSVDWAMRHPQEASDNVSRSAKELSEASGIYKVGEVLYDQLPSKKSIEEVRDAARGNIQLFQQNVDDFAQSNGYGRPLEEFADWRDRQSEFVRDQMTPKYTTLAFDHAVDGKHVEISPDGTTTITDKATGTPESGTSAQTETPASATDANQKLSPPPSDAQFTSEPAVTPYATGVIEGVAAEKNDGIFGILQNLREQMLQSGAGPDTYIQGSLADQLMEAKTSADILRITESHNWSNFQADLPGGSGAESINIHTGDKFSIDAKTGELQIDSADTAAADPTSAKDVLSGRNFIDSRQYPELAKWAEALKAKK